jgi:methylglutaconyl-CoA hydratase
MQTNTVITHIDQRGIATVTLNNPDRHNAFDDHIIAELHQCFEQLDNNQGVRAVILAAAGKSFSAGADLNWMKRMANYSYEENLADAKKLADMLRCLNQLSKPTIARVQGAAFGGAVGLVSCCDMAVGTPRASFALSEAKIGLTPATISPYVIAAIGQRAARRYFLTAERFDAAQALSLGLLSAVVDGEQLDSTIESLLGNLLANSPNAVAIGKKLIASVANQPLTDQLIMHTSEIIAAIRVTEEGQEGLSAFIDKRPPAWQQNNQGESDV